jgi:hypothetical protein
VDRIARRRIPLDASLPVQDAPAEIAPRLLPPVVDLGVERWSPSHAHLKAPSSTMANAVLVVVPLTVPVRRPWPHRHLEQG